MRLVTETADLHAAAEVQSQAYTDQPATEADVARLQRLVAAGGHVALACLDGQPAGSGVSTAPALGASEIAAVAASASFRRRGLAAAVAVVLTQQLLRQEIAPFLQVHAHRQLYERLGYRQVADLIFATLPSSTV
ncbi:MAG: GNAT family N-acetyltransferase [Actinomycetota bacterium]|nr:GNAT family N-acetyltransferase [Actinomycetota bacterium]